MRCWRFLGLKARPVAGEHQKDKPNGTNMACYRLGFSIDDGSLTADTSAWGPALRYRKILLEEDTDVVMSQRFKLVLTIPFPKQLVGFPWFDRPSDSWAARHYDEGGYNYFGGGPVMWKLTAKATVNDFDGLRIESIGQWSCRDFRVLHDHAYDDGN